MEGEFEVRRDGRLVTVLAPQKRIYRVQQSPMTETAIDAGWRRDLLVALGDPLGEGAWSLRVQYRPLIRFIWLGALIMALGGLVALSDPRYRLERARRATSGQAPRSAEVPGTAEAPSRAGALRAAEAPGRAEVPLKAKAPRGAEALRTRKL